tara:strand:- start:564 stop:1019 length:456 start_codon:yes stop_codon:yes gene_type:complete
MGNLNNYIFIYIILLLTGCDDNPVSSNVYECESDCYVAVIAPNLHKDGNGYYHMEWLEGYTQTFTTLDAHTSIEAYYPVSWTSDLGLNYNGNFVPVVNTSSMTNEDDGIAHTIMGVWEVMIGDTVTVYAGLTDWCFEQHTDSIKVIIENEY